MKVYNLTDVPTKVLGAHGLVNQHIVVGKELVQPGDSKDVEDTPYQRGNLEHLITVGAVSIDQLPPPYALAKSKSGQTKNVTQPPKEPPQFVEKVLENVAASDAKKKKDDKKDKL